MDPYKEYWQECISCAADECSLQLTQGQLECLADGAQNGHENYSMAFYSPPATDRILSIEREWQAKYKTLQLEFERYKGKAETAVKQALRQRDDSIISIGEYGEVLLHDGRTDRIQ